jgi:hypothetical protein
LILTRKSHGIVESSVGFTIKLLSSYSFAKKSAIGSVRFKIVSIALACLSGA